MGHHQLHILHPNRLDCLTSGQQAYMQRHQNQYVLRSWGVRVTQEDSHNLEMPILLFFRCRQADLQNVENDNRQKQTHQLF